MTSRLTIAAATAALFAAPAMAQNQNTGDEAATAMQNQQSQQGSAQSGGQNDGSGIMTFNRDRSDVQTGDGQLTEQDRQMMAASQQQVREQLEESGFEQVTVRRAAYLVTAMSPEGEPVMMLVDTSRMGRRDQGGMQGQQGESMQNQQKMQGQTEGQAKQ